MNPDGCWDVGVLEKNRGHLGGRRPRFVYVLHSEGWLTLFFFGLEGNPLHYQAEPQETNAHVLEQELELGNLGA